MFFLEPLLHLFFIDFMLIFSQKCDFGHPWRPIWGPKSAPGPLATRQSVSARFCPARFPYLALHLTSHITFFILVICRLVICRFPAIAGRAKRGCFGEPPGQKGGPPKITQIVFWGSFFRKRLKTENHYNSPLILTLLLQKLLQNLSFSSARLRLFGALFRASVLETNFVGL